MKPVKKNKILFVESLSDSLTNNFKKLIEAFGQKGDYQCEVWSHNLGTADSESQAKLAVNLLRTAADAKVIFLDDTSPLNCLDAVTVRSQTSVEQLWHGCAAFKKWGYSNADGKFGASAKALKEYPRYRNYRHVFVSSLDVIPYYEEAFNLEEAIGVVTPAGVSRTDVFFDPDFRSEAFQRVYDMVPGAQGKKILLYAPTFRGQVKNAYSPQSLDFALLQQSFADDYILLIKHHPHVLDRPLVPEALSSFAFDVTDLLSIDDLIMTADICIADYSSLVFEYALMDRPMFFFADDLEDYCDWRGFFVEYEDFVPGPIARTTEEIIDFIRGLPDSFDHSRLHDFKQTYMSACDGHATQRILDIVMKDMEEK